MGLLLQEACLNLVRPHYGEGMEGKPPFQKLCELGYELPEEFALFPPVMLDIIGVDWVLEGGNDLLAHYIDTCSLPRISPRILMLACLHGGYGREVLAEPLIP